MLLRSILGLIAGLAVAFVLVIAVELFSAVVHPFPEGFGGTKEEICAHVEKYPAWVLAAVVPMWALVVFCSVWVARKIGGLATSIVVGALLLVAVGFNQWMLPYPVWFEVANFVALPLAMPGAIRLARPTVVSLPEEDGDEETPSP
ncbi:hypothetical protein Pan97_30380 [Bremerella volcania]|uniref:Uncharacterized protein n=1 Tax=Bremerella volcania TaxID=2527984 RepID=A0A518C9T5_9BACT|nr:hypothetical protein [Bremerella volcania]QDU75993.1 hypothetical protein Pan97_30380 [Bremerella volcania]